MVNDTGGLGGATGQGEEPGTAGGQSPASEALGDRWIDLFEIDAAPDIQPEMFDEAIGELDRLLKTRPDAKEETIVVLERQFGRGLATSTWADVTNSLAMYCGLGPAHLLNWLVFQNTDSRLAMLDQRADAGVVGYLRSILARFWDELNAAQISVTTSVDDWAKIDKHVYYDGLAGKYLFSLNLTKVNGDVVTLEMTADSLLNLARHVMVMIAAVGNAADFSPDRVSGFVEQLSPVNALFSSREPAQEVVEAETSG